MSEDGSSTHSEYGSDDFPLPNAKRQRVSSDGGAEDEQNTQRAAYTPPSRIKKTAASTNGRSETRVVKDSGSRPSTLTAAGFESLQVTPWLVHSLRSMAVTNPTEIQRSCIPEILKGRDCIGGSKTGTGKTIAFAVPILQKWAEDPFGIYAVILTPTRELALQIFEQFLALGAPQSIKVVLVTGGSDMRPQALALAQRPHIVVATPGRLADHIQTSGAETTVGLRRAKVVVLDEADRLLASGSGSMLPDLNTCLSALPPSSSRLTLLFTATVTPEVRALKSLPRPKDRPPIFVSEINDPMSPTSTLLPPTLRQTYIQVPLPHKDAFLHTLLLTPAFTPSPGHPPPSTIIFVNRTTTADILHRTLLSLSHTVTSLHSQLAQSQRNRNLASFRSLQTKTLIATDVASRGLDIPEVQFVINYDLPRDPRDYVHRVGRTARAGREGTSVSFVTQRDVVLVGGIERYISQGGVGGRNGGAGEDEIGDDGEIEIGKGDDGKDTSVDDGIDTEHGEVPESCKLQLYTQEGVNLETRVIKGRVLKDVLEARMEAMREIEGGKDVNGWRRGVIKKDRKRSRDWDWE